MPSEARGYCENDVSKVVFNFWATIVCVENENTYAKSEIETDSD